ncbi:DUF4123 domain-containing protein [Acinetobacter baumannii]|uniref:DUF4123 domain-containing protein n=1 Tax=Acinetobacter baumannii TaxID=470 RepID=UPI000F73F714|nr:DUF4123 domain-containing protein [Acinetobacter baumannii]MDV7449350.1 DUF4123 domain-containing protein [Acinetobacter baumannii]RSP96134.1 DUF4123 domain-containing protein [Acinetobacter baumannii]
MKSIELLEQISESNLETNFYLLIDAAKEPLFIKKWLKKIPQKKIIQIGNLFEGTIDETTPLEVSPLLVRINSELKYEIETQLLMNNDSEMFSIIETTLSKYELINHLQPFLQAELPNGELALFRFYDPSIVKILNKMLDEENFVLLTTPIKNWWYQSSDNNYLSLKSN